MTDKRAAEIAAEECLRRLYHEDRDACGCSECVPRPTKAGEVTVTQSEAAALAELIRTRLIGVLPEDQDLQLEDGDWRLILDALAQASAQPAPSGDVVAAVGKALHECLSRQDVMAYLDGKFDCDALAQAALSAARPIIERETVEARDEALCLYEQATERLATAERGRDALADALREARLQLEYLDGRQATGTTPAIIARIDAALAGDAAAGDVGDWG